MEVDYRLPLRLNSIFVEDRQQPSGITRVCISVIVFIEWDNIIAMEEFKRSGVFPIDEDREKVTVLTKGGNYVCIGNVEEFAHDWAAYKLWKEKRRIFNLN